MTRELIGGNITNPPLNSEMILIESWFRRMSIISVIIPTWNRKHELQNCLAAVLNQRRNELGIIVSDDGSTDGTDKFLKGLRVESLKVVSCENSGLPSIARNRAISKSGEAQLLAFCDSDDYWLPHKIERQMGAYLNGKARAICSNSYLNNTSEMYFNFEDGYINTLSLLNLNRVICSSMVVEREIIERCDLFDESAELRAYEDYLLWLKVSLFTDIYYISEPLLRYTTASLNSVRSDSLIADERRKLLVLKKFAQFCIEVKKPEYIPFVTLSAVKSLAKLLKFKFKSYENSSHC